MRFTIRDVLWLTALVAVSVAWSVHYRSQSSLRQERDSAINRMTQLTVFLERRGLEVFVDEHRHHVVVWRKDGRDMSPESVAGMAAEPDP